MSYQITMFSNGVIYIAGEPKYVGKMPPPLTCADPEIIDLLRTAGAAINLLDVIETIEFTKKMPFSSEVSPTGEIIVKDKNGEFVMAFGKHYIEKA